MYLSLLNAIFGLLLWVQSSSGEEVNRRLIVQVNYLLELLDIFPDCDQFVFTPGLEVEDLRGVIAPIYLYDPIRLSADVRLDPRFPVALGGTYWWRQQIANEGINSIRSRNCKAQFQLLFTEAGRKFYSELHQQFVFGVDESAFVYSMMLTQIQFFKLDPNFGRHEFGFKLLGDFSIANLRHFIYIQYQFDIKTLTNDMKCANEAKQRPTFQAVIYMFDVNFLRLSCAYCNLNYDVNSLSVDKTGDLDSMLPDFALDGTISVMSRLFQQLHRSVDIITGPITHQVPFLMPNNNYYQDIIRDIRYIREYHGKKYVFSQKRMWPAELIQLSVLADNFPNMTFLNWNTNLNLFDIIPAIWGPTVSFVPQILAGLYRPITETSISFVTCSNVTRERLAQNFYKPFDTFSWMWIVASTLALLPILSMSVQWENTWDTGWRIILIPLRIYLENLDHLPSRKLKRENIASFLILLMALVGLVLSNLYKGVLTADLTALSTIQGPEMLDQLVESNASFYSRYKLFTAPPTTVTMRPNGIPQNMIFDRQEWESVLVKMYLDQYTFPLEQNPLKQPMHRKLYLVLQNLNVLYAENMTVEDEVASCKNSALLQFTQDLGDFEIPEWRIGTLQSQPFVFGKETVAPGIFHWATVGWREGEAYLAIIRCLETGIFKWIESVVKGIDRSALTLNQLLISLSAISERPLSMEQPLISAILHAWRNLVMLGFVVIIGEHIAFTARAFCTREMFQLMLDSDSDE